MAQPRGEKTRISPSEVTSVCPSRLSISSYSNFVNNEGPAFLHGSGQDSGWWWKRSASNQRLRWPLLSKLVLDQFKNERFCLFKLKKNFCTILHIKSDFAEQKKNSSNFSNFQSLGSTSGTWILGAIIAIPVLLLLVGLAIKLASQCSSLRWD